MTSSDKLYVLGHPVGHSKSPVMHNALYARLGLAWSYDFAECPDPADAQAFLDARDFRAINVTMPYKPLAYEAATVRAASARLARGANVLAVKGDELIAYNVDGQGCVGYLERMGVDFSDARVTVCGTGPTSLAILHAVAQAGAGEVLLVGRDKERAREKLTRYADEFKQLAAATIDLPAPEEHHLSFRETYDHVSLRFGSYTTSTQAIAASDVIIDATPLGMNDGDAAPFDTALLSARQTVFDVVYGHGTTALAAAARAAGCAFMDGAGMLVAQAVVSARIFCDIAGVDVPLSFDEMFSVMAQAAEFDLPEPGAVAR